MKKIISAFLVFIMLVFTFIFPCSAVKDYNEWEKMWGNVKLSDGYIMLTPGTDRSKMNFSWQSPFKSQKGEIFISDTQNMENSTELSVKRSLCIFGFEWTQEATAENLKADTTYYYQYTSNGKKSEVYSFKTGSENETKFAFITDAQIGRSYLETDEETYSHDTYGWSKTVETIVENNDVDFLLSAGDQVNTPTSEDEYTYFESPTALRSLPVATAIGNHEFYTTNYLHHFNNPNRNISVPRWPAGNGYFFCYNDILFVVLDSNSILLSAQNKIISAALKAYPNVKWKIAMMHHSPFDANAESEFGNLLSRVDVAPLFDKYNFDVVFCGHDHYYSRSYMVKNMKVTDDIEKNNVYTNPKGTLYITGNCGSGSNFSGIDESEINKYTDVCIQNRIPGYSVINVADGKMSIITYETDTNTVIDNVSIVK